MKDLKDKVALITGCGRDKGIGQAIAFRLAKEKCKIVVHDIGKTKDSRLYKSMPSM